MRDRQREAERYGAGGCHYRGMEQMAFTVPVSGPAAQADERRQMRLELASELDRARIAAGLSHGQLARRAGLSPATVKDALGEEPNPQAETLTAISVALGLRLTISSSG